MKTEIRNLLDELFGIVEAYGDERDTRFKSWAKEITSVDPQGKDGYAFHGEWVNSGTVEVEPGPHVYLVMTQCGSRNYHTATYRVVVMDANGQLAVTNVTTTNEERGWALRIRDGLIEILEAQDPNGTQLLSDFDKYLKACDIIRQLIDSCDDEVYHQSALAHARGFMEDKNQE